LGQKKTETLSFIQISQRVLFERELKHLRMTGNRGIVIIDKEGEVSEVHGVT
jgi:hypothetical protein